MSEMEFMTKLTAMLAEQLKPRIPVEIDLWDTKTIASFLKRSDDQVRERVVCLPDFPKAIRLPAESGGRARPLWKATEVLAWAEKYREVRTKGATA
jgi:hypothetical protein